MALTPEEQRALDYRRSLVARERAEQARKRALRGNAGARRALAERWAPMRSWLDERRGQA